MKNIRHSWLISSMSLLYSGLAQAAAENEPKRLKLTGSQVDTGSAVEVMLSLVLVIVAILVLAWLIRRMGSLGMHANGSMKIIAALNMGAREKVVLLEIGKEQILLGVAPGQITKLHVLDEPLESGVTSASDVATGFSERLRQALKKGQAE